MKLLDSLKALFVNEPVQSPMAETSVLLGLLVEAAMADHILACEEKERLLHWLELKGIEGAEAEQLLHFALAEQQENTSVQPLTHWVAKHLDRDQRKRLVQELWQVVLADGKLDPWEEALMRKLCDLMYVPHSVYVQTKLQAMDS